MAYEKDIDHFIKGDGLDSEREQTIGQHIGYRYDVNLVPDYERLTPLLKRYMEIMGWTDLNWLEMSIWATRTGDPQYSTGTSTAG